MKKKKMKKKKMKKGGGDDQKKVKNIDFFKLKILLPPMIINKNTQLGGFVSVSKRF